MSTAAAPTEAAEICISSLNTHDNITQYYAKNVKKYNKKYQTILAMKKVLSSFLTRGGMNSSMFANCLEFCDVRKVRSWFLAKKEMVGEVQSWVLMLFGELSEHLED